MKTATTHIKKLSATALVAIALVTGAALPAAAGGSISITLEAQDEEQEKAIKGGLLIYSIAKGIESGGGIFQNGNGNAAGVAQNGSGNFGVVHQEGDDHNGTLQQNGNGNTHGIFQFGEGSDSHVAQSGDGNTGVTFGFGWD